MERIEVGQTVRINEEYGVHCAARRDLEVERIDGDRVHVVLGARPDGSAAWRGVERRETLIPVRPATVVLRATRHDACASWATFRQVPGERIEVVAAIGATRAIDEVMTVGRARDLYRSLVGQGWTRNDSGITPARVRAIIRD